ncbi:hypothetical protein AGATL06_01950 [Agathobaculum sp. TL06]
MKAILYADWMNFRLSIKSMLFAPVIILVWAVIAEQPIFFFSMLVVMGYMFPNTAFSAEQSAGWDRLSLSLPILRREVVASRFLLALVVNLTLFVCSLVFATVYCLAHGQPQALMENYMSVLACEAVAIIMIGAELAAAFKWGIQKAGYIMLAAFFLPLALVFAAVSLEIRIPLLTAAGRWLAGVEERRFALLLLGCLAVALVIYLLCYRVSVRLYRKKEL